MPKTGKRGFVYINFNIPQMNYLGIDYGRKRIGLAKANSETKIATPLKTIENNKETAEKLAEIAEKEEISEVVLGIPVSFSGQEGDFASQIRKFGELLQEKLDKKVNYENEMLTSRQSQRQEVGDIDSSAAALILQGFLDRK